MARPEYSVYASCPKCWSGNLSLRYMSDSWNYGCGGHREGNPSFDEHFHRQCYNCGYTWAENVRR